MPDSTLVIPAHFRTALGMLLTAYDYAVDSQADPWQFAVELPQLEVSGATLLDVRWLIVRKFAEHAQETTIPGDASRSFRGLAVTCFPPDTCLVLSEEGANMIRSALNAAPLSGMPGQIANSGAVTSDRTPSLSAPARPEWDATRRELLYKGQIIKRYRVPAPNQETVLSAFQEENWPQYIDDPIPPSDHQDAKYRLQHTIKTLNRNQLNPLIRFHGNGNGLQVYWKEIGSD
jgi:hypothetical protein